MKNRFYSLLPLALFLFLAACGEMGRSYKNAQDLRKDQEKKGLVFLGSFDESWPAEIAETRNAMNTIQFTREDGTPQDYAGFTGYELKLICLKNKSGAKSFFVFRSKEKKTK